MSCTIKSVMNHLQQPLVGGHASCPYVFEGKHVGDNLGFGLAPGALTQYFVQIERHSLLFDQSFDL